MVPGVLLIVVAVVCLIPVNLALTVKRPHDTGRSGAHAMQVALLAIPVVASASGNAALARVLVVAVVSVFFWLVCARGRGAQHVRPRSGGCAAA